MSSDNESMAKVETVTKRKRNRPDLANFGADLAEPGDNARFIRAARVALDLPPIDISDEKQVKQRINEYLNHCESYDIKPSVVGMCNWLGISRDTLNSWKRGEYRSGSHSDTIKKVYTMLEEISIDYFQGGKVNPAAGIFLLKNHFGYRDVTDLTIEPKTNLTDQDAVQIAQKYNELPE